MALSNSTSAAPIEFVLPIAHSATESSKNASPRLEHFSSRVEQSVVSLLRCPRCGSELGNPIAVCEDSIHVSQACVSVTCGLRFPIVDGVPILVDPENSVFDIETFTRRETTFFRPIPKWRALLTSRIPDISKNVAAERVFARLRSLLTSENEIANVLVVGGGVTGSGMACLLEEPKIRLIETDAAIAPRTQLICDAHDLPFADGSMDAVIVQAVLEHVVDPARCVAEIHRVLAPNGIVYSDTPFMQQVHGRQFDFTRFTKLGHRRLFRKFAEIDSGITCGPGMALAWSLRYFLMSFSDNAAFRAVAGAGSRLAFWWLSMLDRFLVKRKSANDAASAFFFLGRKSNIALDDRELLDSYLGGQ